MSNEILSQGVKQPRRETDDSPPSSAKVKNEWSYTCTPLIYLHAVDTDKFTFVIFMLEAVTGMHLVGEWKPDAIGVLSSRFGNSLWM
jgi:hypothetical protein